MLAGEDEQICLDARRHGIVLVRPLGLAALLAGSGAFLLTLDWPWLLAGAAALVVAAAVGLRAVWRWDRTHVVVTTEKLFVVHGTLRRRTAAVRFAGVDALELEQTLLGRLLGYGTLIAGPFEVSCIPDPGGVYRVVERLSG